MYIFQFLSELAGANANTGTAENVLAKTIINEHNYTWVFFAADSNGSLSFIMSYNEPYKNMWS